MAQKAQVMDEKNNEDESKCKIAHRRCEKPMASDSLDRVQDEP